MPFLDLGRSHAPLKQAILDDIAAAIDAGVFVGGPAVRAFEERFAGYCGTTECVGVASGLDALRLALLAGRIEPGDEVVVPANTFIATLEAVRQAGGRPVLVDASEADYNIDVDAAEAAITPQTRFLLPVHLYGQMANMRAIVELAARHGIAVVEDACQAHGAERDGLRAGGAGLAGAFSFYPAKNLGAFGDAGAIVTDDARLASEARALREHGQTEKYVHAREGYTARLDTIQALVLKRKLSELDGWNAGRAAIARRYEEELSEIDDLRLPRVAPGSKPVWHQYVVRTPDAGELGAYLGEQGIETGRHYPVPPHLSAAYADLGHEQGAFPVTEALADELLSLPIFPGLSDEEVERVCNAVRRYFAGA